MLVRALKAKGKATYVVLHANHARELSADARTACARFVDAGIPMLCQSVLLRGVNDDAETLGALMRALVECRIKPYYLHHGDLAPGTAHWRTTIEEGRALTRALHGRYSGLCQPSYVLDIPGGHGKSPIGPCYLTELGVTNGGARYEIEDYRGQRHAYPPVERRRGDPSIRTLQFRFGLSISFCSSWAKYAFRSGVSFPCKSSRRTISRARSTRGAGSSSR